MQSQEYTKRWFQDESTKSECSIGIRTVHHVYVTDEKGIQITFDQLKEELEQESEGYITIIYMIPRNQLSPLYSSELDILEHRFFHRLLVYYIYYNDSILDDHVKVGQRVFEALINSNTRDIICFSVNGSQDLVDHVSVRLIFLGIEELNISTQIC